MDADCPEYCGHAGKCAEERDGITAMENAAENAWRSRPRTAGTRRRKPTSGSTSRCSRTAIVDAMTESRFGREPPWDGPGDHRRRVSAMLPYARGPDERRTLTRAMERAYFHDCSDHEQDVIRDVAARAPPGTIPE